MHSRRTSRQRDIHAGIHQNFPNPPHREPHYRNQFSASQLLVPNLYPIRLPREIKRPIRNAASNHSGYCLLAAGYFFVI